MIAAITVLGATQNGFARVTDAVTVAGRTTAAVRRTRHAIFALLANSVAAYATGLARELSAALV